jgi:hypothetical protein
MGKQNIATSTNKEVPLSTTVCFSQTYHTLQCILYTMPPAPTSIDERQSERERKKEKQADREKELTP